MKIIGFCIGCALTTGLFTRALIAPTETSTDEFTLASVIPNDVFLFEASRPNSQREFVGRYWGEVFDALGQSGVGQEVIGLFGSLVGLGAEQAAEVERIKKRMSQLLEGVDWGKLEGRENAFAERFVPPAPTEFSNQRPPILLADWVWLSRGTSESVAQNYQSLVAILSAIAEEVNKAAGSEVLVLERATRMGAKVTSVNFLAAVPGAPALPLSIARRSDVVIIALREQLLNDVLALMDGSSKKKALAADPRFKAAFVDLPPAEDSMLFFDMQALMTSVRSLVDTLVGVLGAPGDVYRNSAMNSEVAKLNAGALSAYRQDDVKQALTLTSKAYDASPKNTIILYNLACFNALLGNKNEALGWLEKAVDGGFYAPKKIVSDTDLDSLRSEPKYKAALAKAAEMARACCVEDIVIKSSKTGEVFSLTTQAWQAYEKKEYEQALKFTEQAHAVSPTDSRVLYYLACFHTLLGHEDKGLDFLEEAVDGGFYCPLHISKDPDLEKVRSHERYKTSLAKAEKRAAKLAASKRGEETGLIKNLIDRLADAVGILDYTATVESTDGYSVRAESVVVLVPDAKDRPIYPVIAKPQTLTHFDRYLPQETASFTVSGGFDPGALYKFIEDTIGEAGPKGEELLAKWAEIQKTFGVDVQEDVFGWIDGDSISVTLADGGWVWLVKVTSEESAREKIGAGLEFLSTALNEKLPELTAKNPALAVLTMLQVRTSPVEEDELEGFHNLYFGLSPQPVAVWGVADAYLVIGSSANAVALCQATARGDHPNIRSNAQAMSEAIVPAGPFVSVSLSDRRGLGEEIATGVGMVSMGYGMLGTFIPDPKARPVFAKVSGILAKLAPVMRKIDFYKSEAAHATFDGQAWHSRRVTHYFSPEERAAKGAE